MCGDIGDVGDVGDLGDVGHVADIGDTGDRGKATVAASSLVSSIDGSATFSIGAFPCAAIN
jgi:hypothetical protein